MIPKQLQVLVCVAILCLLPAGGAAAQSPIELLSQSVTGEFRDNITAQLTATSQSEITTVEFFYKVIGQSATSRNVADFEPGTQVEARYKIDQTTLYFPPGTRLEYWWKVTTADGISLKTDRQEYLYLDNHHDFKTLNNDRLTLYWYRGDEEFGQTLFDQANQALDRLEVSTGVNIEQPVQVFIYGNHTDLLNAIAVGSQDWTGGQAFTDQGVVVMGVAPADLDWGLKATIHELTHLVIYQATNNPYGDLPRWLDEGLAVYNENPDEIDEQFSHSFQAAVQSNTLMTLQTLSSSFPADSEAANLAYGESGMVVKFIIDTYGAESMHRLLTVFAEGALYDKALQQALKVDTRGLDNAWRASLNLPPLAATGDTQQSPTTEDAQSQPALSNGQPQPQATPLPASVPRSALPCVAGAIPLAAMGLVVTTKRRKN